jgi:hypothetical protein
MNTEENKELKEKILNDEEIRKCINFNNSHNIMISQPKGVMAVSECEKLLKKAIDLTFDEATKQAEKRFNDKTLSKEILLSQAEAQILGWHLGKWGADAEDLINSMGLKKSEWKILKNKYELNYLREDEFNEIEECFSND